MWARSTARRRAGRGESVERWAERGRESCRVRNADTAWLARAGGLTEVEQRRPHAVGRLQVDDRADHIGQGAEAPREHLPAKAADAQVARERDRRQQ
eukprot:1375641-Prymnesium_polylepis.1